jgi:cytochrome c-type biogenesis protein CcmH/NrfF
MILTPISAVSRPCRRPHRPDLQGADDKVGSPDPNARFPLRFPLKTRAPARTGIRPLILLGALAAAGGAQTPPRTGEALTVHPEAREAIEGIRSPFCPGQMLEVCTSSGAAALRDSIQRLAEGGLPAESIVERVIAEYGEEWRAEPLRRGAGLWVWLMPPAILAAGLVGVALVLSRRRSASAPVPAGEVSPSDERRLHEALEELDRSEEPDW